MKWLPRILVFIKVSHLAEKCILLLLILFSTDKLSAGGNILNGMSHVQRRQRNLEAPWIHDGKSSYTWEKSLTLLSWKMSLLMLAKTVELMKVLSVSHTILKISLKWIISQFGNPETHYCNEQTLRKPKFHIHWLHLNLQLTKRRIYELH
jgi:hypothetical protein